ncbi:MAG: hypothetical protein IT235_00520 [Bacteroidia bacterium]|nr:hypothetical protein [Bacteroidia bacterium]
MNNFLKIFTGIFAHLAVFLYLLPFVPLPLHSSSYVLTQYPQNLISKRTNGAYEKSIANYTHEINKDKVCFDFNLDLPITQHHPFISAASETNEHCTDFSDFSFQYILPSSYRGPPPLG